MTSRYRLLQPLATGGMAELFLGVAKGAEGFERTVAIKRVLPHLAREPDISRMFVSEARLAMLLQHQNIVTVHDVGESAEGLFLVMELVDGWDLGALIRAVTRQGLRIPPHLAVFIASQAQAGLQHAYRRQHDGHPVVTAHRDVSPSNLLVSREGEVKVTDFGIARLAGLSRTEPGAFKGKVPYAAPEVLRGEPATALSDQFSLGTILAELLAGQHPFGSAAAEPMAVAYSILNRAPASLPDVPASLATLVLRMLSRDPAARFPEPEDVSEALARWLAQTGEPASSHALATFLRGVRLPMSVGEMARTALAEAPASTSASFVMSVAPHEGMDTGRIPSASGARPGTLAYGGGAAASPAWKAPLASVPVAAEEEEPWSPPAGGVSLSASGAVVHTCALCGTALESPDSPCESCTRGPSAGAPAMSTALPTQAPANGPAGASTSRPKANAASTSRARTQAPSPAPVDAPALATQSISDVDDAARTNRPSIRQAAQGDLELEERAPRVESSPSEFEPMTPSRPRRRWGPAVALLGIAAVLAAGALFVWPQYEAQVLRALGLPSAVLSIRSEPSGATVLVDGVEVGVTPLVMDNVYPARSVPVQLKLKGYRVWTGSFMGGKKSDVAAELKR
ncbi:putative serine/threonine protein kinase [Corallococcus coralloides DSM 2259]|uniref:Putative serine/threonine protein kinase n=1 Tax=Corallococcus coralloides (strain ATCC 25202 / DSM 2259 / NBRC 100086 / M2) TaxID=1144275 RepID=H8MKZ9_CORCM|nr:protein kinase [Corallococcus coralloides]AFE09890.1 putative serine/threonine protein kinase [Corallococcus coralloides DSM 2259]